MIYQPICEAVVKELQLQISSNPKSARNLFQYLLGFNDYYKIIKKDSKKQVIVEGFNFYKSLHKNIPHLPLPNKILKYEFIPNKFGIISKMIITFNEGWQIKFRIHNGDSEVKKSLKFDVTIVSRPEVFQKQLFT